MSKDRYKLHYVRGVCELEKGEVHFIGGIRGVSRSQVWYHVIYALKDKFKEIDFWIDPKLFECRTIPPTENYLRYNICNKFVCEYKPFEKGVIKPKIKISVLDKKQYIEKRSKVDLGVSVELGVVDSMVDDNSNITNFINKHTTDYKVRSTVYIKDGRIYFKDNNDVTYTSLDLKNSRDFYMDSKREMEDIVKRLKYLGDSILACDITYDDFNIALNKLYSGFISNLNRVKLNCREIDLYFLCKAISEDSISVLEYILGKTSVSSNTTYIDMYGKESFDNLSLLYLKLSELLFLLLQITTTIERSACDNVVC